MTFLEERTSVPVWPTVLARMHAASQCGGNPSSLHGLGRVARRYVDEATEALRALLGTGPRDEVVFTGHGAEANALGLLGLARARRTATGANVIVASPSLRHLAVDGFAVRALAAGAFTADVAVVAVTLDDVELAKAARAEGLPVHCDATELAAHVPVDFTALGVNTLAVCSQRLGGPPGVAALIVTKGETLVPLWSGGGQNNGWRSGTQAVAPIAGFGEAARCVRDRLLGMKRDSA